MQRGICLAVALLFIVFPYSESSFAGSDWQQIDASTPFVDHNGIPREPSCSGGPKLTSNGSDVLVEAFAQHVGTPIPALVRR